MSDNLLLKFQRLGGMSTGRDSVMLNEAHFFSNTGTQDLELMIIGIAMQKGALDTVEVK
jgi:hypothetical protein